MARTNVPAKHGNKNVAREIMISKAALTALIKGKYSWIPYSSEDFNHDKRREIALENRA